MGTELLVLPQDHFTKRVKAQYSSVEEALVREVLQNSLDAGATRVEFTIKRDYDTHETIWSAVDNGKGMTLEEFRKYFLVLGGTHKDTNSIGGFGAAKEILAFAWENWWAKGQGFICRGTGAANPESEPDFSQQSGFSIGGSGRLIEKYDLEEAVSKVVRYCVGMKMKVFINCDEVKPISAKMKLLETFKFGDMFAASKNASESIGNVGYAIVTHGNLYSCLHYIGGMRLYHLNISKKLGPLEVFTESRDNLLWDVGHKVNAAAESMRNTAQEKHDDPTCRIFILPTGTGEVTVGQSVSEIEKIPFVGMYSGDIKLTNNQAVGELKRDGFSITAEENKSGLPFQFAILRKPGARKKVSQNATDLTEPDKLAITATHIALGVISKALGKRTPITGILFAKESGVYLMATLSNAVIGVNPKVVFAGPVDLVETIIHELAHAACYGHGADYEAIRSGYVTCLGIKYIKLLIEIVNLYREMGIRVK